MIDWTLDEVICSLAKGFDTKYAHCPKCGAKLLRELYVYSHFGQKQASCIANCLNDVGLGTVRSLMDSRPMEASRTAGLHSDEVSAMRVAARLWLSDRHYRGAEK